MKHGTTVIAFVEDTGGYETEFIQKKRIDSLSKSRSDTYSLSELRNVLRRCEKAAATTRANASSSFAMWGMGRNGIRRATADSTAGAGLNAVAGTSISFSTENRYCNMTDSRL